MIKKFGAGKFYSVSVGAGGYEYLTLKAKRIIETADIIAVPIKKVGEQSTALGIIGELADGKDIMKVLFPMAENKEIRKVHRLHSAELIAEKLNENKNVAMITLGDVSVYSTAFYVNEIISDAGFETETISGVPSFCICAGKANVSLCEGEETLAVVPASSPQIEKIIDSFDNIVVMKAGKKYMPEICRILEERGLAENSVAVSRAGLEGERIFKPEQDSDSGYFTTLIIKKGKKIR